MKRVLMLAYLFPPIANSGTQRPLKFAKYLAEYGWEPIVLTASHFDGHPTDASLVADIPPDITIERVPLLGDYVGDFVSTMLPGRAIARRVGRAISWRMRHHYRLPDLYASWKPLATRAALRIFRHTGFDAIFATGFPWSSLELGALIAERTRRPFVADFRDLWAGENLFLDQRPPRETEWAAEHAIVTSADAVVTASATIARQLLASHPEADSGRFVPIHNGFDPTDLDVSPAEKRPGTFRIVFTGVWKEGYNPAELYESINWIRRVDPALLDRVEIITAGFAAGEARRRGLGDYITELGVVPHDDAIALMKSADLLYLSHVDPERQWVVPGKLYEYLASGAPVLALTHPGRETAQIIERVGGGVTLPPEDPGTLYHALVEALRQRRFQVPRRNAAALAAFERRRLTAKLATVFDDVVHHVPVVAAEPQLSYTTFSTRAGGSAGAATRSS